MSAHPQLPPFESAINLKLAHSFNPTYLEVENESHTHSVPKNSETHFRVLIVSDKFEGVSRVARQRLVYETLATELKGGVHALSLRTYSPEEWEASGESHSTKSPPCFGGSRRSKP